MCCWYGPSVVALTAAQHNAAAACLSTFSSSAEVSTHTVRVLVPGTCLVPTRPSATKWSVPPQIDTRVATLHRTYQHFRDFDALLCQAFLVHPWRSLLVRRESHHTVRDRLQATHRTDVKRPAQTRRCQRRSSTPGRGELAHAEWPVPYPSISDTISERESSNRPSSSPMTMRDGHSGEMASISSTSPLHR
jgi:transposase